MTIAQDWGRQDLFQPPAQVITDLNGLAIAALGEPPPVALMPIEAIQIHPNGHGELINLDGLTASIQAHGVLQPLIVTADGRLLAGRRRLEAARRAGVSMVPVRVCEIQDERAAIEIGLIENIERTDLDPLTRARCYRGLIEQGAEVEEIAALVGQESAHVYQHLALLDLHPAVQQAMEALSLSFVDARTFAKLPPRDQATVLAEIQSASRNQANGKPLSSRQIKLRVDTQRVLRLAQAATATPQEDDAVAPKGDYAALFEMENRFDEKVAIESDHDPLDELNKLIAEMVAAARGEDQARGWARHLSRILKQLQDLREAVKRPQITQERLL